MKTMKLKMSEGWFRAGEVGVDSGHMILVDPCYVSGGCDTDSCYEATTDDATGCGLGHPYQALTEGSGMVTQTGIGDGVYPVYVCRRDMAGWGERNVAMIVDYGSHIMLEEDCQTFELEDN